MSPDKHEAGERWSEDIGVKVNIRRSYNYYHGEETKEGPNPESGMFSSEIRNGGD